MRLPRFALVTLGFAVALSAACGGGTEGSAPPPIDVPTRDASTSNGAPSLTVSVTGAGTGNVTSSPAGIDCPGTCNQTYASATSVTLTATAGTDSVFTGWSGDCSGLAACTVTVDRAMSVAARFSEKLSAVVVTKNGTGSGTVTSSPAGIDCGPTCASGFAPLSTVTLTAVAGPGSTFTGWSGGGCTGTNAVCTLTMPAATEVVATDVVATFAGEKRTLTVTRAGGGTGTVVSTPAGLIDCGTTCTANVDDGAVVQLTATPAMGSTFVGWSGACNGTGACSVTMTTARAVTATFGGSGGALTCSTVNTTGSCTNAQIPEINLGVIDATACHDQCQVKLAEAGVTTGCWVLATNTNCYCRGGVLNLGGSRPGGSCN